MAKVYIDPITRIEGHLSIEMDVQDGKVVDAKCRGDMFRGYETILQGRNPVDANQIVQRICGVCPISHGISSSKCLEDAFGIKPNKNGRVLRNLILAANFIQSHILHFYHLNALDFVDITAILKYRGSDEGMLRIKNWADNELKVKNGRIDQITAVGPFLPRYEGNFYVKDTDTNLDLISGYVKALDIRQKTHQMVALFGGRAPHAIGLVPGGITTVPTKDRIKKFRKLLGEAEDFINDVWSHHVVAVAKTFPEYFKLGKYENFLSYGAFEQDNENKTFTFDRGAVTGDRKLDFTTEVITENVRYGKYRDGSDLHPFKGETLPSPDKKDGYTWIKAPRYKDLPMEVGPLARVVIGYMNGTGGIKVELDKVLRQFNAELPTAYSVLGRHVARLIEGKILAKEMYKWLDEVEVNGKPRNSYTIPDESRGEGLCEAPRGALGHWITVKNKTIENYQCVVPTTWYCSPKDGKGVYGPVEQALIGTPITDVNNPIEAARVVRSFDPCLACAVHVVEGDREIGNFKVC